MLSLGSCPLAAHGVTLTASSSGHALLLAVKANSTFNTSAERGGGLRDLADGSWAQRRNSTTVGCDVGLARPKLVLVGALLTCRSRPARAAGIDVDRRWHSMPRSQRTRRALRTFVVELGLLVGGLLGLAVALQAPNSASSTCRGNIGACIGAGITDAAMPLLLKTFGGALLGLLIAAALIRLLGRQPAPTGRRPV